MPPKRKRPYTAREKALAAARALLKRKPKDPLLLDVRKHCTYADFILIVSGTSIRQTQTLADFLEETLHRQGIRLRAVEGKEGGQWILMDYDDLIVHIFYDPTRLFYDLEGLWLEAPRLPLPKVSPEAEGEESS
jgi:ribosome-associated protein